MPQLVNDPAGFFHSATVGSVAPRVLAAVAIVGLLGASPARAQMDGATRPGADPRKASESRVVTDVGTPEEEQRKDDSDRVHESYEPKGVQAGSFLILPKVEVDEMFNSNVYARDKDAKSDLVNVVRPVVKVRSEFERHALNLVAQGERYTYNHYSHDNHLDAFARADGRLDVTDQTLFTGALRAYSQHEDRGSPDEAGGDSPTPNYGWQTEAGFDQRFGNFRLQLNGDGLRSKFGNVEAGSGTSIHNGDRNRLEMKGQARGSYEFFPGYAAVTEMSMNRRSYDLTYDDDGYQRDSSGYRVEGGIGVDISKLVRGDFLLGYLAQDYEDSRYSDPAGFSFKASFNWTPDEVTVIVPTLQRSVLETTQVGASARISSVASLLFRRELQRNIILSAYAAATLDEPQGLKGSDAWTTQGRARITYAFSPMLFVAGEIDQKHKISQTSTSSFDQTMLTLRLGVQM